MQTRKVTPAVKAEEYQIYSRKQAEVYMKMGKDKFKKLSAIHGCFYIPNGNRHFYKLSSLNKFWDSLNPLNN